MTEETQVNYLCDICGTKYAVPEAALQCESFAWKPPMEVGKSYLNKTTLDVAKLLAIWAIPVIAWKFNLDRTIETTPKCHRWIIRLSEDIAIGCPEATREYPDGNSYDFALLARNDAEWHEEWEEVQEEDACR